MDVINRELLVERFGAWPSFHDSEVYGLRLDSGQRADGVPRLELDVHVFDVQGTLPDGRLKLVDHTLVTLEFEAVEALEIRDFGPQNVLDARRAFRLRQPHIEALGGVLDRSDVRRQPCSGVATTPPRSMVHVQVSCWPAASSSCTWSSP